VAQAVTAGTRRLAWVGVRSADGVPRRALAVQVGIALFLIATSTFEEVVAYAGVVLNLMNLLAVLGVMRLRRIAPELPRPFRVPLYPFVPLGFTAISVWMIGFTISQRPGVLLSAVATLGLGIGLHRLVGTRT
jgi:APA family basic amino acid/polyamine antiporter